MRLAYALAIVVFGACATMRPNVELGQYAPVLDTLYQRMGNRELLLCLDGNRVGRHWYVTRAYIPIQTADSMNVYGDGCTESPGDIHNHPPLGGSCRCEPVSKFSDVDLLQFLTHPNLRFTVLWYAPGHYTAEIKTIPK